MKARTSLRWWVAAVAGACVPAAWAQVTPAEPFGGRPFGAATAPAPQPQQAPAPVLVQPGAAPVVVQPSAAPVVVQPPAMQGSVGPTTRPSSSVAPQTNLPGGVPQGAVPPQMASPMGSNNPSTPVAQERNAPPSPAPAPVTPPFQGQRANASPSAAAPQQQAAPVKGLPADAPRLVVSGGVWSSNPAQRRLIVNGQPVREGAEVDGVLVEQVQRDGAVLGFRGSRYNVLF